MDGVQVYLIGHGYAPVFRVTDGTGQVVFDGPVPFIPVAQAGLTSEGVIKVPDAQPQQLGFAGVFLPTAADAAASWCRSSPPPLQPGGSLVSYAGNLGMNSGPSQSVYQLDTSGMHQLAVAPRPLSLGQSITLPHGEGTLTFTGYRQWISLAITHDPGQLPALISAMVALAGLILSFLVRRRRVFLRQPAGPGGQTIVDFGGLARSDAAGGFEVGVRRAGRGTAHRGKDGVSRASGGGHGSRSAQERRLPANRPRPRPRPRCRPSRGEQAAQPVSSGNDQALGSAEGE